MKLLIRLCFRLIPHNINVRTSPLNNKTKTRINLWAAFADRDSAALQRMCDAFEREFWHSEYDLWMLNESWGDFSQLIRNASDDNDRITETMRDADYVLACLTPDLIEEDLVAQLRRAHALGKEIIVFYYGRKCDKKGHPISPRFSADLFLLLQGARQVALWGSPTAEFEAIFSRKEPCSTPIHSTSVFISHNHRDYDMARKIYDHLAQQSADIFLSGVSLPQLGSCDYMKEIDKALETAQHMVVAGTSIENIMSGWVEAEWRLFINEKRSGRKSGNIITVINGGLKPSELPMSLRYYEVIDLGAEDLIRIGNYLS